MNGANGMTGGFGGKAEGGGSTLAAALRAGDALNALTAAVTRAAPSLAPSADLARSQLSAAWGSAQPWGEFLDRRKFVPPTSASDLRERLVDNLTHFGANYVLCFLFVSAASILVHPFSFLAVLSVAALYVWLFLSNPDAVRLGPLNVPPKAKFPVFGFCALTILYLSNAVSALGSWALFAVLVSFAHAAARISAKEPDFESPVDSV